MKIEVSMIVKNEEAVLERCLESVKDADLITIIDTGSTDKTIKIGKKYTSKIYYGDRYKWRGDFAFHRNQALNKCKKGNWILIIDADEVLEKGGIQKIREFIKGINPDIKKGIIFNTISSTIQNTQNRQVRMFYNDGSIKWHGVAHNYLDAKESEKIDSDLTIHYGHSPTHAKDPDRTFKILKKYVKNNINCTREKYYLAKEYYYRRDTDKALMYFDEYTNESNHIAEVADAYMISAYCFYNTGKFQDAKACCIKAILCNADFKEPFILMSKISGSQRNNKKWLEFSELCNNKDVLFVRTKNSKPIKKEEKTEEYYNQLFSNDYDMSRYERIFSKIKNITGETKILDIGCGTGKLSTYYKSVNDYHGFDFSKVAIDKANKKYKNKMFWISDVYNKINYSLQYNYYICTEVFEHVNDLKLLENVDSGQKIIFSVPSFNDPAHLRTYTEELVKSRYKGILDIKSIMRFNWDLKNKKWDSAISNTDLYILLVNAIKK